MTAVGAAARAVVRESVVSSPRSPGLAEGRARPEYGRCVAIVTTAALRQLDRLPAARRGRAARRRLHPRSAALAGVLLGVVLAGLPLSLVMTTSGAAWDNAKKHIEEAGDKHSPAHAAAVVGDTVGDATKDAAGPAINPLVKVVNTVSLLCVGIVAHHHALFG